MVTVLLEVIFTFWHRPMLIVWVVSKKDPYTATPGQVMWKGTDE